MFGLPGAYVLKYKSVPSTIVPYTLRILKIYQLLHIWQSLFSTFLNKGETESNSYVMVLWSVFSVSTVGVINTLFNHIKKIFKVQEDRKKLESVKVTILQ